MLLQSDTRFKPFYIICAYSRKRNKIQEQHLSTEMSLKQRCQSLDIATRRAKEFAKSLNEISLQSTNDWEPKLYLKTETNKYLLETKF